MKLIKFTLPFLVAMQVYEMQAQQLPVFTQYQANRSYINPAAINMDAIEHNRNLFAGVSYRKQWDGLETGPTTQILHGSFRSDNNHSVNLLAGGYLINDSADKVGFTGLYGRIGGLVTKNPERYGFSAGLTFGGVQYRLDLSGTDLLDPLAATNQNQINMDVGLGLFAYSLVGNYNYIYGGLSIPQTLGLDLSYRTTNSIFSAKRIQHYYGLLGYYMPLNRTNHFIEGSAWFKYIPNVPFNMDFNFRYNLEYLWLGVGYGTSGTVHAEFGVNVGYITDVDSNIQIGYGFDLITGNNIGGNFGSTHEINFTITMDTY